MKNIVIFFLLISFSSFAQGDQKTSNKKFALGFTFSPDYCFRTLEADSDVQFIADSRNENEKPKFGYTSGINFDWLISKRFSLETGILLSDKGEKTKDYQLYYIQYDPNSPIKVNYNYHYYYFDIPLKANFNLTTGKFKFFISAGVSANLFLFEKNITRLEYEDGHKSRKKSTGDPGFNRINPAMIAGLGFTYDISENIFFKAEPVYRRSLSSVIDGSVRGYYYSIGINTGIYMKF